MRALTWVLTVLAVGGVPRGWAHHMVPPTAYQLGSGKQIPSTNVRIGGYLNLVLHDFANAGARFDAADLSLLTTWDPGHRWMAFSEIEIEDGVTVDDRGVTGHDVEIVVERFYADYAAKPWLSLRLGKFLTPFGRWNLVHAAPLVWSTSRPLVTDLPLANHATGVAAHGNLRAGGNRLEYVAYLDYSDALDPTDQPSRFEGLGTSGNALFDYAGGVQIRYHFLRGHGELAGSFTSFRMAGRDARKHLAGLERSPGDMAQYWNEQYYHGVSPPVVLASPEAVVRFVAATRGAVGYVLDCDVDDRVRIVMKVPLPVGAAAAGARCVAPVAGG